jgi:hypothetical protein
MSKQTAVYVAIFSTAAIAIGWYGRGWIGASRELESTIKKMAGIKATRDRLAGVVALVAVTTAAVLYVIAGKHK